MNYVDPKGLDYCGFTGSEWALIQASMHYVRRYDPDPASGIYYLPGQITGAWMPGKGWAVTRVLPFTNHAGRPVRFNRYNLDGTDDYYLSLVQVSATLANELWHVRYDGYTPSTWSDGSKAFEGRFLRKWADSVYDEISPTLDAAGFFEEGADIDIRNFSPQIREKYAIWNALNSVISQYHSGPMVRPYPRPRPSPGPSPGCRR